MAERRVRGIFDRAQLELLGDLLLLRRVCLLSIVDAQPFDLEIAGPTERCLFARGIQEEILGSSTLSALDEVGATAAGRKQFLTGMAQHQGRPVHRLAVAELGSPTEARYSPCPKPLKRLLRHILPRGEEARESLPPYNCANRHLVLSSSGHLGISWWKTLRIASVITSRSGDIRTRMSRLLQVSEQKWTLFFWGSLPKLLKPNSRFRGQLLPKIN